MRILQVKLSNFRNYGETEVSLIPGRNILIGENAQGKTNLLEAVELLSTGKAARADQDADLIQWNEQHLFAEVTFIRNGYEERVSIALARKPASRGMKSSNRIDKSVKINGVSQPSMRSVCGQLLTVSFKSHDLNFLRGGPRYRRDWIDMLVLKLRPAFQETYANYQKVVAQRNKLLKTLFEKGKVTVSDQDQLVVWDKQLARYAARIIKERLSMLDSLLPYAGEHQGALSRQQEKLSVRYLLRAPDQPSSEDRADDDDEDIADGDDEVSLPASNLLAMEESELAQTLFKLLKQRRFEEIRRKQTLLGPHRDDLIIGLNERDAVSFASQGQQRSIVLALKLAELRKIQETFEQPPVLLLDDVLAELDEFRQGLLMGAIADDMQAIITTTHVSGFDQRWLHGAQIMKVSAGVIACSETASV